MQSKYQRWYDDIIEHARERELDCYHERHHVLPRSLGGWDDPVNLVELTYREHFLAHWLLTKIYDGAARRAMVYALHCMTMSLGGRIIAGWQFEVAKRAVKAEVLKKATARRAEWEKERKQELREWRGSKKRAEQEAPALDPSRRKDREKLKALAVDWLKGVRPRRRRRPWKPPRPRKKLEKVA